MVSSLNFAIIIFLFLNSQTNAVYPSWFLKMPVMRGVIFAVGYAPRYAFLSSSFEEARKSLKRELCYAIRTHVKGERAFLKEDLQIAYMGGTFGVTPDTLSVSEPVVLDSAVLKNMVLILGASQQIKDWRKCLFNFDTWWELFPETANFICDKGIAPIYFYEHHSWEEAEQNARIALAMQISTEIRGFRKFFYDLTSGVTVESTGVYLQRAQIVGRYLDREKETVYVLVSISAE